MAPREVPRARSVLGLLARFASGQGVPASPAWLLDYDVGEAFCVRGCAGRAAPTCRTYRSGVYQLGGPVHRPPGQRGDPFGGAEAAPAHPPGERGGPHAGGPALRAPVGGKGSGGGEGAGRVGGPCPGQDGVEGGAAGRRARGDGGVGAPGLAWRKSAGPVRDEMVAFAAGLIERSGQAPAIEAALAHPTGRPRPLPVRAVLTALLCLALADRPLFSTQSTTLLFSHPSYSSRPLPAS